MAADWSPPVDLFEATEGLGCVRAMTPSDLPAVLEIERLSQPSPWTEQVFARELELDFSQIWIIEAPGLSTELAGYLVFWIIHDELHILNVVIHPQARRRGIARRLLEHLVARAYRQGITTLTLEVRASNEAAMGLYHALGFRQIGLRERYYPDNHEDAVVLARIIEDHDAAP